MTKPTNLVLYHSSCTDGLVAAYLLYLYFKETGVDAEYVPVRYNEPMPDVTDRAVFIVDFSYSQEEIFKASEKAVSILMLDHHLTAAKEWGGYKNECHQLMNDDVKDQSKKKGCIINTHIVEDMSGAGLVYEYVRESIRAGVTDDELSNSVFFNRDDDRLDKIVKAVQDRDLWKFKLEDTKLIYELLSSMEQSFKSLDYLIYDISVSEFNEKIKEAKAYLKLKEKLAYDYADKYQSITFQGYDIPIVNCPANFASRVGEILALGSPFAFTYCLSTTKVYCSLRSTVGTGVDVSEIAKRLNGGGHFHAAGLSLTIPDLVKLLNSEL